ncbi:SH3 domain-containing protein [Solidesulfovibrio sp.]|uniref:SH3 domain-containing protein n=1 Tax=Solidesulfovibrio sp. TaxID=2910990 RepID=UPI0026268CF2|nr:SH3 domain-containing protein [Solidesulfovibrio sp.]
MNTRLVFLMFALMLLSALIVAFTAVAQAQMAPQSMQQNPARTPMGTPPMVMSSQQQAILAEAWTLTPQATARASMTDLPLRNCEGLYCGVLAKMPLGTPVEILVNDLEGWALVHVPSLNMYGWVNTNNIF